MAIFTVLLGMLLLPGFREEDSVIAEPPQEEEVVVEESSNPSVCESTGPWTKIDVPGENATPNEVSYTAPEGQIIEAVCVKGGQEDVSPGGYLYSTTEDGWFIREGVKCLLITGIGTNSVTVMRNTDAPGNVCAEISHASFKTAEEESTPTPEPTPTPTEETPEPTPTPTEETPEPTPTPTDEETPPPTEESTPTPTEEVVVVGVQTGAPRPTNRTPGIITMFSAFGIIGALGFFLWKHLKA